MQTIQERDDGDLGQDAAGLGARKGYALSIYEGTANRIYSQLTSAPVPRLSLT